MSDLFLGFVFVVMILAPAIVASIQWTSYMPVESESLTEDQTVPLNES